MKPATQKRIDTLVNLLEVYAPNLEQATLDDFAGVVTLMLKEQDRDARYACADTVLANKDDYAMAPNILLRAYQACINTQSI